MPLEDIKKSILEQARSEADQLRVKGEEHIAKINDDWLEKIEERKNAILISAKRKADQKVSQTIFKVQAKAQTELLNKKQTLINQVYKLALKKLTELDEGRYVDLMEKLINKLPTNDGKLISVKDKESLLEKALKRSDKKLEMSKETLSGNGGFVFHSKELEIDNTFATLINNSKDDTILTISGLLFNETT